MHINDLRDDLKMIKEEIIEFRNFIINGQGNGKTKLTGNGTMSTSREKPKGDVKLTPNPVNDRSLAIEKSQKSQMVKK